jgi:hypothetical protein
VAEPEPRTDGVKRTPEDLPVIAGGESLPGDALLAAAPHMGARAAAFARQWVAGWRAHDERTGATEPY